MARSAATARKGKQKKKGPFSADRPQADNNNNPSVVEGEHKETVESDSIILAKIQENEIKDDVRSSEPQADKSSRQECPSGDVEHKETVESENEIKDDVKSSQPQSDKSCTEECTSGESPNHQSDSPENTECTILSQEIDTQYQKYEDNFAVYIENYQFPEDISKNGKRKLMKNLRYDFFRPFKQLVRRMKVKRKKAEGGDQAAPAFKRRKCYTLKDSQNKLRIAIDCSYDDLMSDKDISKLSSQIQRCYSINRHMENPLQLHVTQMEGKLFTRMEKYMDGYKNWDIHCKNESLAGLFQPEDIVYLCAESENTLTDFDSNKIYAIGGFVDHNSHKGLAYERAVAAGFGHARLPIDSYFTLSTRKVLTVCHVYEMISVFSTSKDWKTAIENIMPERKGLEEKNDLENDISEHAITSSSDSLQNKVESSEDRNIDIKDTDLKNLDECNEPK